MKISFILHKPWLVTDKAYCRILKIQRLRETWLEPYYVLENVNIDRQFSFRRHPFNNWFLEILYSMFYTIPEWNKKKWFHTSSGILVILIAYHERYKGRGVSPAQRSCQGW